MGDFLTFIWYSIDNTDGYPGVGIPYTHYLEDRIPVRSAAACTSSGRRGFFYRKKPSGQDRTAEARNYVAFSTRCSQRIP